MKRELTAHEEVIVMIDGMRECLSDMEDQFPGQVYYLAAMAPAETRRVSSSQVAQMYPALFQLAGRSFGYQDWLRAYVVPAAVREATRGEPTKYVTRTGRVLTEEDLDRYAEEAAR
jgi:hypothetical protein